MYYITKNNVITLTRGDYLKFPVKLKTGDFPNEEIYELEENDVVYFGLMEYNQPFERAILKFEYVKEDQDPEGNINIEIRPEDTIGLDQGTYYYEVKVLYLPKGEDTNDVRIHTIIPRTKFILVE